MVRALHHYLMAVCFAGSLMLLPHYCAQSIIDYETSPQPDYDYNVTFDYFSNISIEEMEKFFRKEFDHDKGEDETDPPPTASIKPNKAFKTEYPSLLLMPILTAHLLLRLL